MPHTIQSGPGPGRVPPLDQQEQGVSPLDILKRLNPRQAPQEREEPEEAPTPLSVLKAAQEAPVEEPGPLLIHPAFPELGELPEFTRPFVNFAQGFNQRIAEVVAAPVQLVDEGLKLAGASILDGQDPVVAVQEAFQQLGINSDPVEGLSKDLGRNTFDAAVTLAIFYAAAPAAVAKGAAQEAGPVARAVGDVGRFMLTQPATTAVTEAGAIAGGTVGEREFGPSGAIPGAIIGGMGIGTLPGMARRAAQSALPTAGAIAGGTAGVEGGPLGVAAGAGAGAFAGQRLNALGRQGMRFVQRLLRGQGDQPRPVVDPEAEPVFTRSFSEEQIASDIGRVESSLQETLRAVAGKEPVEASTIMRRGIERAETVGRRLENVFWARVPKEAEVDPAVGGGLHETMMTIIRDNPRGTPEALPSKFIQRIMRLSTKPTPVPGAPKARSPTPITVKELIAIRGAILRANRAERAKVGANSPLIRNQTILAKAIEDAVEAQVPGVATQQARAFSRRFNDLFTRGPVGRLLRYQAPGDPRVDAAQSTDFLLGQFEGFRQITSIADELRQPQVLQQAEEAVKAAFRQEAQALGKAPEDVLRRFEPAIRSLRGLTAELGVVSTRLRTLLDGKQALEKSALAKFAQADPDKAVQAIMNAQDPAGEARKLIAEMNRTFLGAGRERPDAAEAVAGFKNGVLFELFRRSSFSGLNMQKLLATPKIKRLVATVLDASDINRLERIVAASARVEKGEETTGRRLTRGAGTVLARVVGAQAGRQLAIVTGGGTVQTPAIISQLAKNTFIDTVFGATPEKLLVQAVTDPAAERLLLSRFPVTDDQMKALSRRVRLFISAVEGERQKTLRTLERGDRRDPRGLQ